MTMLMTTTTTMTSTVTIIIIVSAVDDSWVIHDPRRDSHKVYNREHLGCCWVLPSTII